MFLKQKHIVLLIFIFSVTFAKVKVVKNRSFFFTYLYLFLYFKLAEWPTEEMAKILSESCTESENCSEEIFSKILNNCVHSEIESELFLDSVGYTTEFREWFKRNYFFLFSKEKGNF